MRKDENITGRFEIRNDSSLILIPDNQEENNKLPLPPMLWVGEVILTNTPTAVGGIVWFHALGNGEHKLAGFTDMVWLSPYSHDEKENPNEIDWQAKINQLRNDGIKALRGNLNDS